MDKPENPMRSVASGNKKVPSTPEGWVEWEEQRVAYLRAVGAQGQEWASKEYDNWRFWVVYQFRKRAIRHTTREVGIWLPDYCGVDGKPDITELAKAAVVSKHTVRTHLKRLAAIGADFSHMRDWPHPLRGAGLTACADSTS
jgi:hypothetical protein